jgi:hypothetical protein
MIGEFFDPLVEDMAHMGYAPVGGDVHRIVSACTSWLCASVVCDGQRPVGAVGENLRYLVGVFI